MRVELTGRHVDITPAMRRLVERKLARLERVLNDSALSAQVVLTDEKRGRRVDITLHARGEKFLHGDGASAAWETSLTQAIDKIAQQVQKVKGKWQEWKRRGVKGAVVGSEERGAAAGRSAPRSGRIRPRMPRILRSSKQVVKEMSVTAAARAVEADGDGVLVFRDAETAVVSVIYRRANGELMVIETDT